MVGIAAASHHPKSFFPTGTLPRCREAVRELLLPLSTWVGETKSFRCTSLCNELTSVARDVSRNSMAFNAFRITFSSVRKASPDFGGVATCDGTRLAPGSPVSM